MFPQKFHGAWQAFEADGPVREGGTFVNKAEAQRFCNRMNQLLLPPQPVVAALDHVDVDDPTTRRRNRNESRRQDALYRNARRVYETDRD